MHKQDRAGIRRYLNRARMLLLFVTAAFVGWGPIETGNTGEPGNDKPRVVMLIAEDEYHTEVTLPEFARKHLANDFEITLVTGNPQERNDLPGIEAVKQADVLVVSVRRRLLPPAQLEVVRQYVAAGKPVVGIRTACHAFCLKNEPAPEGLADWPSFDPDVFGGHYTGHHKAGPVVKVTQADGASQHPILSGVDTGQFESVGSLYKVSPIDSRAKPLLVGEIPDQPREPIAWTFERTDGGRSFFTSLGHEQDFESENFTRLLINAIRWAAGVTGNTR